MADAVEAIRDNVDQEASDRLGGRKVHDGTSVARFDPVVFPLERYGVGIGTDQAAV